MNVHRRQELLFTICLLVPGLIALPVAVWDQTHWSPLSRVDSIPESVRTVFAASYLLWFLTCVVVFGRRRLALKRAVQGSGGLTCTACGYDLRSCKDKRCAECGAAFDEEHVKRFWQRTFPKWRWEK